MAGFTLTFGTYAEPSFIGMKGIITRSAPQVDGSGNVSQVTWTVTIASDGTASVGGLPYNDDGTTYRCEWQALGYKPTPGNRVFQVLSTSGIVTQDYDQLPAASAVSFGPPVLPLVTSVAGRSGAVTLTKADVGLGNVDNTADAAKPVSTAQAAALAGKAVIADIPTAGTATGDALRAAFVAVVPPSGDTTGATDTATLNAALAAGSVRLKRGGAYYITKAAGQAVCLFAGQVDGTVLDARNATITEVTGANCPMFADLGHAQMLNGGAWVASNGLEVWGGTWNRQGNTGAGNGLHTIILGGQRIRARDLRITSTAGKYSVLFQNATDFEYENIHLDSVASDGVHIQGPATRGRGRNIHGTTGDDLHAITACDYPAYTWGNEGDVTDIKVDGLTTVGGGSRAAIVVSGKNGATVLNVKGVRIRNISGTQSGTNTQPAVIIGEDTSQSNTSGGQLDQIDIDGVNVPLNTPGQGIVSLNGSATCLATPSIKVRNVDVSSDCSAVVSQTAKTTNLLVAGVRGKTTAAAITGIVSFGNGASWASVSTCTVEDVDLTCAATGGAIVRASISGQTLTDLYLNRVVVTALAWIIDAITATGLHVTSARLNSMGSGLLNPRTGAAFVIHSWSGVNNTSTSFSTTTGGTVRSLDYAFPLDITNATLNAAKTQGDRCTTRSVAGSIPVSVPVGLKGANWVEIAGQTTFTAV